MKNNFLSKVTKMPQNTGGGNLQTKRATLALPLRYLCAMLLVLVLGIGNVWAQDPQDTYYKFPDAKTSGQKVSPISGESNDITVGSNGVTSSAFTFAGTEYDKGLKIGNTLAKGATLSIPASTTNPAHVFIVCSGSNKDVYLELNSTKEATANVYSSTSPIPGVMELVVTKSGNYNLYASGDVFCYEIRILYEKNNNVVKTYQSGVGMSITSSSAWDSETEELLFFKPMEVTVDKTNKRYTFGGTATAPGRRTIKFTAYADGSLEVGAMCSNNSNRNLQLKKMNGASFSDALVTSSNIQKGATTTLEYASIEEGTTYVLVASGSDMHVTSIEFTPDAPAATYDATFANGGHGTPPAKAEGVSSVTLTEITGVDGWKNTGWTADKATKVGTTDKAAGTTLNIGDVVTLLENTTFTAQWAQLYTVTYNKAAGEEGDVPTQVPLVDGSTFDVAGQGSLAPPTPGQVFRGWNDGIAAEPYKEGDEYTIAGANVNFTAVWGATTSYTITLDAKGGSVASYDSWTKVGDVYSKTVVEGTTVPLLAFTKADVQLMFFRDGSANEYSGSVTLNSDMNLSAVWGEEKEVTIYSWESPSGTAIEEGGVASYYTDPTTKDGSNERVNYANTAQGTTYHTICLNGGAGFADKQIKIALDQNIEAGDEIKMTAYFNTENTSKKASAKMYTEAGAKIFDGDDLPNIYSEGSPVEQTYTALAGGTKDIKMTRLQTGSNTFITKLVITGTRVEEVKDPCETPTITAQPAGGTYNWNEDASQSVTASVTDGGTLKYQWYKKGTPDAKVGTNSNAFTPTESGTYYVIVTNTKDGYGDADKKSDEVAVTINARPSYTVTYYDGSSKIGEEDVLEAANPAEYEAKQAKAVYGVTGLYEFNGWYNNSDLAEAHKIANIAALSITANTPIYGKWTRIEAEDVNLVTYAATITGDESTEEEMNAFKTWFTGKGYAYANLNALDNKAGNNGAYLGLKTKSDAAYVAFNVPANKRVTIKLGYMKTAAEMYINGVKNETQALTGGSTGSGDNFADWHYDVTEASTLKLQMKSTGTCVVKAITIGEIPAESDDATLSDLKVGGTTISGFSPSVTSYYVEMPYGTAKADLPLVTVTTNEEHATADIQDAKDRPSDTRATIHVVAQNGTSDKYYYVYFTVAPKLGVGVFTYTPVGSNGENAAEGYKGGTADIYLQTSKTSGGYKLGSVGHFIGIIPTGGLKANDIICINIADLQGASALTFFDQKEDGRVQVITPAPAPKVGLNYVTVPADMDKIYLYRADGTCNPSVISVSVYRLMAPFIEKFEIAGVEATISGTSITAEVPAVTDVTALTPTVKYWANGGGTIDKTGVQNFTDPVTYTVSSSYADDATGAYAPVTYTVTVTKAAASTNVELATLTVNGNAVTVVPGQAVYNYELPYGTSAAPVVEVTAEDANAEVGTITQAASTTGSATFTVTAEDGTTTRDYTINFSISKWKEVVIWDGSTMGAVKTVQTEDIASWEAVGFTGVESWSYATDEPAGKVPAYCSDNDKTYTHVNGSGKNECNIFRTGGNTKNSRYFKITVPKDYVAKFYVVYGSHGEGTEVTMSIGNEASATASDGILSLTTDHRYLLSGGISEIVGAGDYYLNATASADFFEIRAYLRPGHARTAMLGNGVLGTVCVPNNVAIEDIQGATFYELQGREPEYGKLAFDEIVSGELEAGAPYVFQAHGDKLVLFYGNTKVDDPVNKGNGMYGTFVAQTLTELDGIYYFAQKALWSCVDLTSLSLPANRAYVKLGEINYLGSSAPAPGRKRLMIGVNGAPAVATGIESAEANEAPRKVLINGELFILRGEKMYDAKGQLVK